ncbi:MAG: MFS transporter [Gammaproteobacteria bacterium]|nr:MFS transporter [Gammaproteobacteria bacterium]
MMGGAIMLVSQIVISWIALKGFEEELGPELNQKASAVGRALSTELTYAINELGIPPGKLVGVSEYFQHILESNFDIQYLALVDNPSGVMFEHSVPDKLLDQFPATLHESDGSHNSHSIRDIGGYLDHRFPIHFKGDSSAALHVGVSSGNIRQQLATIFFEVIAVIVVSMVITLELLTMFMSRRILDPTAHLQKVLEAGSKGKFSYRLSLRARNEIGLMVSSLNRLLYHLEQRYQDFQFELRELRDAQIDPRISQKIAALKTQASKRYGFTDQFSVIEKTPALIRVPFFLFIFSEELSRSFFPLFVSGFIPVEPALSYEMMISLPITLFMVAAVVATLLAGNLTHRLGCSRLFLIGIGCAFAGYCGTFLSDNYTELIIWRCLNGVGYGLIFNACETWIALHSRAGNRAHSASAYVGAIFAGYVCGPSLGGMFADHVGQQTIFLISAGLSVLSGYAAYRLLASSSSGPGKNAGSAPNARVFGMRPWAILFSDNLFISTILTAISTRTTLSAFLFVLIPLYLNELGHSSTQIGQMMMLYGVIIVIGTPATSRLADKIGKYFTMTVMGATLSGLGLLATLASDHLGDSRAVLISIVAVGLGHCLILSPRYAIMQQIVYRYRHLIESSVSIGIYQFVDRIGLIIGPLLAAILIQQMPYANAIAAIGAIVLVAITLSAIIANVGQSQIKGESSA